LKSYFFILFFWDFEVVAATPLTLDEGLNCDVAGLRCGLDFVNKMVIWHQGFLLRGSFQNF
jgi:hypothetical protein